MRPSGCEVEPLEWDQVVHQHMTKLSEKYGDIFRNKLGSYR
jgi:hypothetical protein